MVIPDKLYYIRGNFSDLDGGGNWCQCDFVSARNNIPSSWSNLKEKTHKLQTIEIVATYIRSSSSYRPKAHDLAVWADGSHIYKGRYHIYQLGLAKRVRSFSLLTVYVRVIAFPFFSYFGE